MSLLSFFFFSFSFSFFFKKKSVFVHFCVLGVADGCEPPHGAIHGLDPWPRPDASKNDEIEDGDDLAALAHAVKSDGYVPHTAAPKAVAKAFQHAFGTTFVPRYGDPMAASLKHGLVYTRENRAHWRTIDTNLAKMREFYDLWYFDTHKAKETEVSNLM